MSKTFNLKKYLEKQASNYSEGAQGYFLAQTRAWMNCTKIKLEAGMGAQEAWQSCLEDYEKSDGTLGWVGKYASDLSTELEKQGQAAGGGYQLQMDPYWDRIKSKMGKGKTAGQAVLETLDECKKDADKIPSD